MATVAEQNVLSPRVGVGALASPLEVGADTAPAALAGLQEWIQRQGFGAVNLGVIGTPDAARAAGRLADERHVDALALIAVSWFEDYLVLDAWEECSAPLLLWARPGMETGALCGTQQLACYLRQLEAPYRCVFGELNDVPVQTASSQYLRAAALRAQLRRARIGLAGHRVQGMTEVCANEIALKKAIGPRIVTLDVPQLLASAEAQDGKQASELWEQMAQRGACQVDQSTGADAMKVYLAVRSLIAEHGLDALTVGCYPHLMGRVCLAASRLADEGIPLGCEGDVNGAVAQLILQRLSGQPTHNTDWLDPLADDTVVFTHCGSGSLSLAEKPDDVTFAPVRLMDHGVCALFAAKPGPVTLLNLMPVGDSYQVALLRGEALATEMVFPGNPVRVRFAPTAADLIEWIAAEGVGHHWMVGYGDYTGEIRQWAKMCGGALHLVSPES